MRPQDALDLLRANPDKAMKECTFVIIRSSTENVGCRCSIEIEALNEARDENMFLITLAKNDTARDYFFPFETQSDFGTVIVPKACAAGTLVFSDGMNGCSLQVNDNTPANTLTFMHCRNNAGTPADKMLCRVDYKHYAGPEIVSGQWKLGFSFRFLTYDINLTSYAYYPITVKTAENKWSVFMSGVASDMNKDNYKIYGTNVRDVYKMCSFKT